MVNSRPYQFAQKAHGHAVVFHCVPLPRNRAPFRTICGMRHDRWVFADKVRAGPLCKRCFGHSREGATQ
jgi:hypothetical protein